MTMESTVYTGESPTPHPVEIVLKALEPTVVGFISGDVQKLAETSRYLALGLKIAGLATETVGTVLSTIALGPLAGVATYLCGRAVSLAAERTSQ